MDQAYYEEHARETHFLEWRHPRYPKGDMRGGQFRPINRPGIYLQRDKVGESFYLSADEIRKEGNLEWRNIAPEKLALLIGKLHNRSQLSSDLQCADNDVSTIQEVLNIWCVTTGGDKRALAMQRAAQECLKIQETETSHFSEEYRENEFYDRNRIALQQIIATIYDTTQEFLKSHSLSFVTVYRGMRIKSDPGVGRDGMITTTNFQPLTSFSNRYKHASVFSKYVFSARFPAQDVVSLPMTGFGASAEGEFIIRGGPRSIFLTYGLSETEFYAIAKSRGVLKALQTCTAIPSPDTHLANADWTKISWNLADVDSLAALLKYLKRAGFSIDQFKQLPIYGFNVRKLGFLKQI